MISASDANKTNSQRENVRANRRSDFISAELLWGVKVQVQGFQDSENNRPPGKMINILLNMIMAVFQKYPHKTSINVWER